MKQDLMLLWYGIRRFGFAVRLGFKDAMNGNVKSWRKAEDAIWDIPEEEHENT